VEGYIGEGWNGKDPASSSGLVAVSLSVLAFGYPAEKVVLEQVGRTGICTIGGIRPGFTLSRNGCFLMS
jgi:hypothetical protein